MDIYEELMRKHRSELIKFCMLRMNRGYAAAEDVVQEVFLTLYRKKNIDLNDNIRAWLFSTAVNKIKEYNRRNPVFDELNEATDISDESADMEKESALEVLSAEERELIEAYYSCENKSVLAKEQGITLLALYGKVKRIRKKLYNNLVELNNMKT